MLSNLRVPGVYVQEISTLPASVAAVPTAVPAFLGYTEISSDELRAEPVRIENLLEYEATFGRGPGVRITNVAMTPRDTLEAVTASLDYYLYESVRLFYANGGGVCYVLSVGAFRDDNQVVNTDFLPGADPDANFKKLASIDEITLLGAPDAVRLSAAELGNLQQQMIRHCSDQQDRFAVLDLKQTEAEPIGVDIDAFRNGTGVSTLSYAAAYAPYLRIRPLQHYTLATLSNVVLSQGGADTTVGNYVSGLAGGDPALAATHLNATRWSTILSLQTAYVADINDAGNQDALVAAINEMATAFNIDLTDGNTPERYLPLFNYRQSVLDNAQPAEVTANYEATTPVLDFLSGAETALRNAIPAYRELVTAAEAGLFDLPPSGAVLGVYAGTDDRRGVWKAPANVSISGTFGPSERFSNSELAAMNVHPTGKSINAIRAFPGKGTLVYGARTLDGQDGEYRYVPVRRLLIFLEESIKKAVEHHVFEPNDANTWTRVQGMIENFLNLQWRAGALQGATPDEAYRVAIGLGKTMTAADVTNGLMIVNISLAPVRPAEFIVLRFSQMQAQS